MIAVEGRWKITKMRTGGGWNASISGPWTDSTPVPVVPCDDAAVERATDALLADSGLPRYGGYRANVEWRVRVVLRAAGEC